MSKSELLNILYAERSRVEKQYSRLGWTVWAIVAAWASLGWIALGLADEVNDWSYAISVFYLLMFALLVYGSIASAFPKHRGTPMFEKEDFKSRVQAIVMGGLTIGLLVAQWIFIPHDFYPVLYWIAFAGALLFLIECLQVVLMTHTGHVNMGKDWWDVIMCLKFIPMIILLALYIWPLGYNSESLQIGVLAFAAYYLFLIFPFGETNNFDQIDGLINKVLYGDDEVDEKAVLGELERYVVGLKYGSYLSEKQLEDLKKSTLALIKTSDALVSSLQEGNMIGVDAIAKEGYKGYKITKRNYDNLMMVINMIYGDRKQDDKSLNPIFEVSKIVDEVLKFWEIVVTKEKRKHVYHVDRISFAHQSTIGKPEVRKMIGEVLNPETRNKK